MKIGIISDIHSNIIALKACIEYMESISCDEYFFLGDYVSDTPYTRETMDYLYEFMTKATCRFLRGNREEYMLTQRDVIANNREKERWLWNSASGNLLFAYEQLNEKDFEFFQSLPITFQYKKADYPAITCCHGSPESTRELLLVDKDNTKTWLDNIDTEYLISAHTHFPCEMTHKGKHYFNSGCVGIAINDCGFAQCMILEDIIENGRVEWKPTFLKIPYDNKKVVEDIKKSGLLDKAPWFINSNIHILLTGIDHSAEMVNAASNKAKETDKEAAWPRIEEKYFEEAAKELEVPDYRIKEGTKVMQTILVVLDSEKLENPDLDIRYELPDGVEQYTHNEILDNGYDYLTDMKLGIWMKTQSAKGNFSKVVEFFEQHMVCGNDLSGTAKVYISEKDSAPLEECTLVYDGEEQIPDAVVRENNRIQKIRKIILRIAGLITNENVEVIGQLENETNTLLNTEEQWNCITKVLKKSKYICECDENIELSEFLKVLKENVTVKTNELPIKKDKLDEDGDLYEWCEALDEQWADKGYCMAIFELEYENEIVFPCSIEKLEEISELAKEICVSIVAVAEY